MAKNTVEVRLDDLDGTVLYEGEGRSVTVALDDERVNLDLTSENFEQLRNLLDPYFRAGRGQNIPEQQRRIVGPAPRQQNKTPTPQTDRRGLQEIREWARRNGYKVSERGRVPYSVMDAYTKSHLATR